MTFRPSIHGWPFGEVHPVDAHVLGVGSAPAGELGLGGGLCWAALDRYLRGVEVSRRTPRPEPGDALYAELVRRQVAALAGVWSQVEEWQGRPDGSWRDRLPIRVPGGRDAASLTRSEWPGIRARLDAGEPVLLTLLKPADGYRRSRSAGQVLAVSWTRRRSRVTIHLYDPSRPGDDEARLSFGGAGGLNARLGDGTAVRGFFAVPYDREMPLALKVETFADRSVIGLNRKVRGRLEPVASRRRIDVVARDPNGALLHFRRERGKSWEGSNVTDRHELGTFELHSDPIVVARGRTLDIFARSYVGDLIHFRCGRRWEVFNRTDHKRAGLQFRLHGRPSVAAGSRGHMSVVGVDKDGGLVHYWRRPLRGWRAEQVAGDPLSEDPVALRLDGRLHVLGVGMDGRLRHWEWDGTAWAAAVPSTGPELDDDVRLAAGLTVEIVDGEVLVAARSRDGRLITYRRAAGGAWTQEVLADGIAGEPASCDGPAGLHLFASRDDGGLLHAWHDGGWETEDVLGTRPSLGRLPRSGRLAAWGSPSELRVWAREDADFWSLHWRADSDWSGERLSERAGVENRHRPGDDPVVLTDDRGQPHLFFTDGLGTVLHLEPGEWRAPGYPDVSGGVTAPTPSTPAEEPAVVTPAKPEVPAVEPEPVREPEPLPLLEMPDEEELPGTPAVEEPEGEPQGAPEPVADTPAEPAADLPYLDFDADPAPPREFGYDGGRADAPEPEETEASDAGEPAQEESGTERRYPQVPRFARKTRRARASEPDVEPDPEVEPMDLTLMDTWPPPSRSAQRRKARDGDQREREAS